MQVNSAAIKQLILEQGVDLVGIAGANELILAHPPRPATDLMPSARSVIVMAVAHSLGAVCSPHIMLWTRSKMQTSRLLDQAAEKLGRILEKEGFLTLPISADKPVEIFKRDPASGKRFPHTRVAGFLSFKHAAASCGMGQLGRSNLLLTPEYGPHQRLCCIVTEAPLEPDQRRDLDLCIEGCSKCEQACPVDALRDGAYSVDPCFDYWTFGFRRMKPKRLREWPGYLKMLFEHSRRRDIMVEMGQTFITDVDYCIECMRACPVGSSWKNTRPDRIPPMKSAASP